MYLSIFIAILMGLISAGQPKTQQNSANSTQYENPVPPPTDDTGGENGHVPPPRP